MKIGSVIAEIVFLVFGLVVDIVLLVNQRNPPSTFGQNWVSDRLNIVVVVIVVGDGWWWCRVIFM